MVIKLGNIYGFTGGNFAGNVYSTKGIAPALKTMQGGNRQPLIIEKKKKQIPIDGTINKPRGGLTVANCIKARYDCGISNQRQDGTMVLEVTYEKDTTRQKHART